MAVKIAVTREYEDEKRHVHSNRLLLFLLQKKNNRFKWYIFLTLHLTAVFVNLRKKCALDCSTITSLNEIYNTCPIAYWIAYWIVECLALKSYGFESSSMYVFFSFLFSICSFFRLFS